MVKDDLELQVFALSMQKEGAIEYFAEHLPVGAVRDGGRGLADIYQTLLDFYNKTGVTRIDKVALQSWLENEDPDLQKALGGKDSFESLLKEMETIKETSTPEAVAALLRYRHNKSRQTYSAKELNDLVQVADHSEEHISKINELADKIRQLNQTGVDPLRSVYDGERIAADAEALWELPSFLPTQFKSLNRAMGYSDDAGFMKGAVHAILAASGKGKSTFAKNLMNHWVEEGNSVLYINYEEARAHWERILFTQITQQNVYLGKEVSEVDKRHYTQLFKDKMMEWDGRFMVKHDPDTPYYEDLEVWIRDVANRKSAPDVVIIDTIQSMFLKGTGKSLPRWGQYEEMMVRLEKLAKELDAVIIITAQENSNRMKERREVVQQSDIGGSLSIAQKSSATIFITDAKTESGDDSIDETVMQLQIPKNRITGVAYMMDPPLVKYHDESKSYVELELPPLERYDSTLDVAEIGEPY